MILLYVLIFAMPLTRHPLWSDFVGDLTLIKYLGLVCLAYALVYHGARGDGFAPRILETAQSRWSLVFTGLAMTSFLFAGPRIPLEISPFMNGLSFLLLLYVTIVIVDTPARLQRILLAAVGSVALASLYVLREWQKSGFSNVRPGWVTGDPNYFTISALIFLPVAVHLIPQCRSMVERVFCLSALGITTVAVIVGASRGGFLALVVASLYDTLRSSGKIRRGAIVAAILLTIGLVSPLSPLDRFMNPGHGDQIAMESRLWLWAAGLNAAVKNPILGIGAGNFKQVVLRYGDLTSDSAYTLLAHNTYIQVAAELGALGLLSFLCVMATTFVSLERVRQSSADPDRTPLLGAAATGMQAGLLAYAVSAFFVSAEWQKLFWLLVFLSACIPQIERAMAEEPSEPAEADVFVNQRAEG